MAFHRANRLTSRLPVLRRAVQLLGDLLAAVRETWISIGIKGQRFVSNAGIAVAVLITIGFLDQSHWLLRLENGAMDMMMELNKGLDRMSSTTSSAPLLFTLLDIDDETNRAWGEPYHTPRDKLQKLIEFARSSGARMIVVDIDVSRQGLQPDDDRALTDYLVNYESESSPPLILVRSFYPGGSTDATWQEIRPSFLDDHELPESIYWGQPLFQATLWDGIVRHWHLARYGCLDDKLVLVPSIQLTASALLSDSAGTSRSIDIEAMALGNCADGELQNEVAGLPTEIGQRLIYTIPWDEPAPDLVTIPAAAITESVGEFADDLVRDRVVFIGASFADARDIHRTPIGAMPGVMVVINATKSLVTFGQLREPSLLVSLSVQLSVVLLAAWAFSQFESFFAVGVCAVAVFLLLIPTSFYFLRYGMWVEYSIPLFAMVAHRGIAEYRDIRQRLRDGESVRRSVP